MWKYLGWPLAIAAVVGAYIIYAQGSQREAGLKLELAEAQQTLVQVSNRLAVVEAQFNTYKLAQEREMRELRDKQSRDKELGTAPAWRASEPLAEKRTAPNPPPGTEAEATEDYKPRRATGNNGRSVGDGINSLLDRLRDGFDN